MSGPRRSTDQNVRFSGLALVGTVAALLVTTGCASGASTPQAPSAPAGVHGASAGEPVTAATARGDGTTVRLVDVRVVRERDTDRIVLAFDQGTPGYDIRFARPSDVLGPDRRPVALTGTTALVVTLSPVETGPAGVPARLPVGISESENGVVEELVRVSAGGGSMSWAAGVRERVPFTITTEQSRLSIDLFHDD